MNRLFIAFLILTFTYIVLYPVSEASNKNFSIINESPNQKKKKYNTTVKKINKKRHHRHTKDKKKNYGYNYREGLNLLHDFKFSIDYLQKTYSEDDTKRIFKPILKLFLKDAYKNHKDAQYMVGLMFLNGNYVTQDKEKAIYWLEKASFQKHYLATELLKLLKKGDNYNKCSSLFQ